MSTSASSAVRVIRPIDLRVVHNRWQGEAEPMPNTQLIATEVITVVLYRVMLLSVAPVVLNFVVWQILAAHKHQLGQRLSLALLVCATILLMPVMYYAVSIGFGFVARWRHDSIATIQEDVCAERGRIASVWAVGISALLINNIIIAYLAILFR